MLHVGLDLSRRRLDYCLLDEAGERVEVGAAAPDADGLDAFADRVERRFGPVAVRAAIESMTGARFVHDTLERGGWEVEIADAIKVKGLAPLACKTDKIDAWVLAELSRRDLVPAIWLPDFAQRAERERARWRLHLVKHRSSLKHRVHSALMTFGHACPVADLFGAAGRELLARLDFPDPWRSDVLAAVGLIDDLDRQITAIERELRRLGADHRYVSLLQTVPGIAWVLGYTIAAEIGDITRFPTPKSWPATPDCARRCASPAAQTGAARSPRTAPSICAGRYWKRPPTHANTPSTATATNAPRPAWAANAAPRSRRSTSPAASARRSGTCSPATSPSARQAPRSLWPPDGPH